MHDLGAMVHELALASPAFRTLDLGGETRDGLRAVAPLHVLAEALSVTRQAVHKKNSQRIDPTIVVTRSNT